MAKVLSIFGYPEELTELALEALDHDSQKGMFGARGIKPSSDEDKKLLRLFDDECAKMGIPVTHEDSPQKYREVLLSFKKDK